MNRYDFYSEFIKGNKIRLRELYNELHECYETRSELYVIIRHHRDILHIASINIDTIIKSILYEDSKFVLTKYHRYKLPDYLYSIIKNFTHISNTRIPKIKSELKIVNILYNMPDRMYYIMQATANKEISNTILRGDVYTFGQRLSRLGIQYVKRRVNAKPCPDWGESMKLKRKLIEEGHTVKDSNNPNGIKWLLFRTDDGYSFWKWEKSNAFTPNKKMYKFRAIATNNECTDYGGTLTQEQILDKNIGTFDKMMALLKLNPKIIERYDF